MDNLTSTNKINALQNDEPQLKDISGYAKMVTQDLKKLELVPDKIRYKNRDFKKLLSKELNKEANKDNLIQIKNDAYNGQEKEALGYKMNKKEALSAELWFGNEYNKGLYSMTKSQKGRTIDKILKPQSIGKNTKLNRINLASKLEEAIKKSKDASKDMKKDINKDINKDIEEDLTRKRY